MTATSARTSLASLAILVCVTLVTAAAFIAVTYAEWDWLSALLGSVVIILLVVCVRLMLDALEIWLDRAEGEGDGSKPR